MRDRVHDSDPGSQEKASVDIRPERRAKPDRQNLSPSETQRSVFEIEHAGEQKQPSENMRASEPVQAGGGHHWDGEERGNKKIAARGKMQSDGQPYHRNDREREQCRHAVK